MEDNIFDKVHEVDLKKTMETSYIDYAMSVIASRALPDVRDGLKPVQRRILYSMIELNNGPDKPHRKSARIVGDTMGKYHPHGDSSIYGALVNMAQEWSTRYPLVDGHGNFGSVDGDGAAAMRYTEARLSKISMELTADINKDTVDFMPNFDETSKQSRTGKSFGLWCQYCLHSWQVWAARARSLHCMLHWVLRLQQSWLGNGIMKQKGSSLSMRHLLERRH